MTTSSQARSPRGLGHLDAPDDAVIRVDGPATAEDVAAIVAVLAALAGADGAHRSADRASGWAAPRAAMRRPVGHGPAAWRTSLRP
jgi:Acyl-CoA carboxylase epsilon subunit